MTTRPPPPLPRSTLNATLPADAKLSVTDFIVKASALAMHKVPELNSSWLDHAIRAYSNVDISVAVAVPDGLITPIVRDADTKGLLAISRSVRRIGPRAAAPTRPPPPPVVQRHPHARRESARPHARARGLPGRHLHDLEPRCVPPSRHYFFFFKAAGRPYAFPPPRPLPPAGMYGVRQFSAIINTPQAAILAVGAAERRVVPDTTPGAEVPYKQAFVMSVTLSCDHRVVDGAVGAQWLAAFRGYLEAPTTMLL